MFQIFVYQRDSDDVQGSKVGRLLTLCTSTTPRATTHTIYRVAALEIKQCSAYHMGALKSDSHNCVYPSALTCASLMSPHKPLPLS